MLVLSLGMAVHMGASAQDASRVYVEQSGWAIGTTFGTTDLWGNVGTKSPIDHYANSHYTDKIVFMGGIMGRYTVHPCLAFRFEGSFGTLYATDVWNEDAAKKGTTQDPDAYQRWARHQDAKTYIEEGMALMEFEPFRLNPESRTANRRGQIYVDLGVAYMHFTPYTTVGETGTWVNAYNLDLEGEGFGKGYPPQFSLWTPSIPMGIGYRWDVGKHLNIGCEFLFRYTFSKYLDAVSGTYISDEAFAQHLSAKLAAEAAVTADKGYQYNLEQPNNAGNERGTGKNEAFSSFTISIYYKIFPANSMWWKTHS